MKCISLTAEYAWCVAMGLKPGETRKWKTSYRGPLLIAASKRVNTNAYAYLVGIGIQLPTPDALERGKIIAITNLDDCAPFVKANEPQTLCPLYPGYVFWLSGTKMLEKPVPVKGALGLYNVPWPVTAP